MVDDKNLSPEERLFKVIQEEKKSVPAKSVGRDAPGVSPAGGPVPGGIQGFWTKLRGALGGMGLLHKMGSKAPPPMESKEKGPKPLFASPIALQGIDTVKNLLSNGIDLDIVNRFFILALMGLAAVIGHYAFHGKASTAKLMETVSRIKFENLESAVIEPFQAVEYYMEQVKQRDIFNPIEKVEKPVIVEAPKPEPAPPPPAPKPQLKDMAKNFKVVGIAWGESPKVMVRDEGGQEIYFLKEGDPIGKTEIKIKTIKRDGVVISFQDEEMDLF